MNQIKLLRERLGVTQDAMATGLGVSQPNISNYERGQQMPPDVARRLISWAYSLGHVLTYEDIYGALPPMPRRRRADRHSRRE